MQLSEKSKKIINDSLLRIYSPEILYQKLQQHVYGNETMLKQTSVLVYSWLRSLLYFDTSHFQKPNFIIEGPSGSGKTTLAHALKEILDPIPVLLRDTSHLTPAGYKGTNYDAIVKDYSLADAEFGIVFLDELDKRMTSREHDDGFSDASLNSLLRLLEGDKIVLDNDIGLSIYTENILFIGIGAFEDILPFPSRTSNVIGFNSEPDTDEDKRKILTLNDLSDYCKNRQFIGRFVTLLHMEKPSYESLSKVLDTTLSDMKTVLGSKPRIKTRREELIADAMMGISGCRSLRAAVWEEILGTGGLGAFFKQPEIVGRKEKGAKITSNAGDLPK